MPPKTLVLEAWSFWAVSIGFGFRMAQEKERKEKAAATPPRRRPGEEAGVKVSRWKGSR